MGVEMQKENYKRSMSCGCIEWRNWDGKELREHKRKLWELSKWMRLETGNEREPQEKLLSWDRQNGNTSQGRRISWVKKKVQWNKRMQDAWLAFET